MLDRARAAYPDSRFIRCSAADHVGPVEGYDTIVALFSASYLTPAAIDHLTAQLAPGGNAYFLHYADGYQPVTHERTGVSVPWYANDEDGERIGNYKLVTRSAP